MYINENKMCKNGNQTTIFQSVKHLLHKDGFYMDAKEDCASASGGQ